MKISFFFPEIFKERFCWTFYSHRNFVIVMKYHHDCSLDREMFWKDWGTAFPFWFSQEAKTFFPFKMEKLISYLIKIQFPYVQFIYELL